MVGDIKSAGLCMCCREGEAVEVVPVSRGIIGDVGVEVGWLSSSSMSSC